jgi:Na+/H+ antiporter NhaD/arsenite permease-like protein
MQIFQPFFIAGIDFEFFVFAFTLLGVALFHHHTLKVALGGLAVLLVYKLLFTPFNFVHHISDESSTLINLFGLLLGFAILAKHFEHSGIPAKLPHYLPDDWKGGFLLLVLVFILSSFLDNIAAAMIGGGIAHVIFRKKVHIGYLAGIVAASNAGGCGSVLGDTTTTMMWIDGVDFGDVIHAYAAAVPAFLVLGIFASVQQHKYQPILKDEIVGVHISWKRLLATALILVGAVAANVMFDFPALGVWIAIFAGAFFIRPEWHELKYAMPGTVFLISLVLSASMMPVEHLPQASWQTALALGFISAVFDNIPLTKLALDQGGYDWGVLAYTVGYGGSMVWFGSSAGVAISTLFPEARSVGKWIKNGWHVVLAYVVGFFIMLQVFGWHPHAPHKEHKATPEKEQTH